MKLVVNALATRPGGALTVLLGVLRAWQRAALDWQITVLASVPQTLEALRASGLSCRIEPLLVGAGSLRRTWWQSRRLGAWLRQARADALLTNNHWLPRIGCPQVVHHHNLWQFLTPDLGVPPRRRFGENWRNARARDALTRAAANVFVSHFLRRQAERFVPESAPRNSVIPNALDDEVVDRALELPTTRASRPWLVSVQSANPHKDHSTLLRAFARVTALEPSADWRLRIAGTAGRASWQPVEALARELGVAERIEWCGFSHAARLRELIGESLCLVSTSRLESSGLTLLEALGEGCVPVASRIPAFEEYAGPAAVLVPPQDVDAFAQAIVTLWRDPARRAELVERGRQQLAGYRWSDWAPRLVAIIEHAPGGGG
ncbi:MAG: glycosyltransferase family 4 protein [Pirellulales bacterium]|nr:glycosyltransferase family 4 protein [Pirellulales bacterium]